MTAALATHRKGPQMDVTSPAAYFLPPALARKLRTQPVEDRVDDLLAVRDRRRIEHQRPAGDLEQQPLEPIAASAIAAAPLAQVHAPQLQRGPWRCRRSDRE